MGSPQALFSFAMPIPRSISSAQTLRPYQIEALQAVRDAIGRGVRRLVLSLATGLGKSVIFAHLPATLDETHMLVLAHRQELVDQAAAHLRRANPRDDIAIEQADRAAYADAQIVIASVATLGRADSSRIKKFTSRHFGVIVIDEAQHCTADSYLRILRYFGAGEPNGPVLVGVTATPFRGDGTSLANVFDETVYEKTLRSGIADGWLCRARALRVQSQVDLRNLHTRLGDFADTELAGAANTDYRNSVLCSAIENHAADRNCILVFCVDIAHVETVTKQLQDRGHAAEGLTTWTSRQDRWQALRRFRDGQTRIMVNCGVLTEGYDNPAIDCLVMGRPTKSPLLYTQMLGRATRQSPDTGKKDALIIDIVDVCGRHRIQTAATAFGLREIDLLGGDVLQAAETCERAAQRGVTVQDGESIADVERHSARADQLAKRTIHVTTMAEAIDLFATVALAEEVERDSIFPWLRHADNHYVLHIARGRDAHLTRDARGMWTCEVTGVGGLNCGSGEAAPFQWADGVVKRFAGELPPREEGEKSTPLWKVLALDARWRRESPTEKQIATLQRMGIRLLPPGLTKGAASQMLAKLFASRGARQVA